MPTVPAETLDLRPETAPSKRVRPLVRWPGGKTRMLDRLLPQIPADATLYAEVFCGGAALLLAKPRHRVEILNDINGELVALFRNAQRHPEALVEALGWAVLSRRDFFDRMAHPGVTEIERAASFLLRCRSSFSGGQKSFAVRKTPGREIDRESMAQRVREFHARTNRVVVENLPWQRLLKNYDAPGSFFFLDPPYVGESTGAYEGFGQPQMAELATALRRLKGRWLLTVNDSPANRSLFAGCHIRPVATKNGRRKSTPGGTNATFGELIITPT